MPEGIYGQPIWHGPTVPVLQTCCVVIGSTFARPTMPRFPGSRLSGARNANPGPFGRGSATSACFSCHLRCNSSSAEADSEPHLHQRTFRQILSNLSSDSLDMTLRNDNSHPPLAPEETIRFRAFPLAIRRELSTLLQASNSPRSPPHRTRAPHAAMRNSRARNREIGRAHV